MSLVDRKPGRPEGHRALDEERERDHPHDDRELLSETEPAEYLAAGPGSANELHIGRPQAAASAHDRSPALRTSTSEACQARRGEKIVKATRQRLERSARRDRWRLSRLTTPRLTFLSWTRKPGCRSVDRSWLAMDVCSRNGDRVLPHDGSALQVIDQSLPTAFGVRQIRMAEGSGRSSNRGPSLACRKRCMLTTAAPTFAAGPSREGAKTQASRSIGAHRASRILAATSNA